MRMLTDSSTGPQQAGPTAKVDRAVLQAVVLLKRAGLQTIAETASALAGQDIHYRRFAEPNVRTALDRLDAAGLVRDDGFLAGKAASVATVAGLRQVGNAR